MIGYLKGEVLSKTENSVLLNVNGVGYDVNMAQSSLSGLKEGLTAEIFIQESISPFDGTVLYGFTDIEDKNLFNLFREAIPNTGAKKALEFLNKALKSLPDFQRAIMTKDPRLLTGIFGFTSKTAEKLINFLKDKMPSMDISGAAGIKIAETSGLPPALTQVLDALSSLGYTSAEARKSVDLLYKEGINPGEPAEILVKKALRHLAR